MEARRQAEAKRVQEEFERLKNQEAEEVLRETLKNESFVKSEFNESAVERIIKPVTDMFEF